MRAHNIFNVEIDSASWTLKPSGSLRAIVRSFQVSQIISWLPDVSILIAYAICKSGSFPSS